MTTPAQSPTTANSATPGITLSDVTEALNHPIIHRSIGVAVAIVLAVVIYAGLRRLLHAAANSNHAVNQFRHPLSRVLRWIYLPIAALFVLQQAGVNLGILWTLISAGLAMVAIGFVAVWSVLSNISAAFMILTTRLFRIGDHIAITEPVAKEGLSGTVVDNNLLFTTIALSQSPDATVVKVPNNIFFQKAVHISKTPYNLTPQTDKDPSSDNQGADSTSQKE